MEVHELSKILALILVAGGPERMPARVAWPLHTALREWQEELGRAGTQDSLGLDWSIRASSEVGLEVVGANEALSRLVREGLLRPEGHGRAAELVVDPEVAVLQRRRLMRLSPLAVELFQRAGTRWATLVSTAAKNRAMPSRSSAGSVSSAIPNLRKAVLTDGA